MQKMEETQILSLGQEDPLEEGMATHSSILAWKIPWTGAWWAAVQRVAKSWTGLKRLSTIKIRAVRLQVSDNDGMDFGIRDRKCLADEPSLGRKHPAWQPNPGHSCHRVTVSKSFHRYCPGNPAVLLEPREHPWKPERPRAGSLTHALHPNTAPTGHISSL